MKPTKLTPIVLFFAIILTSSFAHAASFFSSYADLYTVGSSGSTTAQNTFAYTDQPYLFVQFYSAPLPNSIPSTMTLSAWTDPNNVISSTSAVTNGNQAWLSFTAAQWNTIKTAGTWNITAISADPTFQTQPFYGTTSFKVNAAINVAPEPVSYVLFLLGALVMGFGILNRKKLGVA